MSSSSSSARKRKAIIIGGGIAGCAASILLQRIGIECEVFERDTEVRNEGAFVNIAENGLHCLDVIGIDVSKLNPLLTKSMTFCTHTLKPIYVMDMGTTYNIMRADLSKAMREHAINEGVKIQLGKRLVDVKLASTEVSVIFEDGTETKGDLLVGCDGIHSVVRKIVFPEAPVPLYSGIIGTGGIAHMPELESTHNDIKMVFGLENFFGYGVMDNHDVYWWNNFYMEKAPTKEELYRMDTEEWFQKAFQKHQNDAHPIPEIIKRSTTEFVRWPIYNLIDLQKWHKGIVCMIGDAAHAVAPHGGQGASMALEDAIVLAQCLRDYEDIELAFEKFQNARYERVTSIARQARRSGSSKTSSSWLGRVIRDFLLPIFLRMGAGLVKTMQEYRADPTFSLKKLAVENVDHIDISANNNNNIEK
eukprot:TRINITY_DN5343_c0_g1_i1.p1 TRINITY_DN5343_c0_g1~~TRINITY_DN5343_c0_g1_i1.p1  ORF type:complete len:418 (-),score=78.94 TRINITY_DN5343_c0_g1_i1:35-1288(-)